MKNLLFTLVILVCTLIVYSQESKEKIMLSLYTSHLTNPEYVYGKVKEIHYQSYKAVDNDGKLEKGDPISFSGASGNEMARPHSYFFNSKGQLIKKSIKADDGDVWNGIVNRHNKKITKVYWIKNDTLFSYFDFIYKTDYIVERHFKNINTDEAFGKITYNIDKKGHLLKFEGYNRDGKLVWLSQFERDDDGKTLSTVMTNEDGETVFQAKDFVYNDKGLHESSYSIIGNKKEVNKRTPNVKYIFDQNGNWIKKISPKIITERSFVYFD